MVTYNQKLAWVSEEYGKYTPENYYLLKDHEGWSDGFIADLVGMYQTEIQAKAQLRSLKPSSRMRFIIEKEKAPAIQSLIDQTAGYTHTIDDLEPVFIDGPRLALKLKNATTFEYVNPQLLAHFTKTYGDVVLKIAEEPNKPVRVENGDGILLGLLMPLLVERK